MLGEAAGRSISVGSVSVGVSVVCLCCVLFPVVYPSSLPPTSVRLLCGRFSIQLPSILGEVCVCVCVFVYGVM